MPRNSCRISCLHFVDLWPAFAYISSLLATFRRHFDLSSCSGTTFRPVALGRHFDLPCCSGTPFRPALLLQDDISTSPAAPGRHFDLSCEVRSYKIIISLLFHLWLDKEAVQSLFPERQMPPNLYF